MFSTQEREELQINKAMFEDMRDKLVQIPDAPVRLLSLVQDVIDSLDDLLHPIIVEDYLPIDDDQSEAV